MKRLLFTGACGFLGNNIQPILNNSFHIDTLGTQKSNYYCCNLATDLSIINQKYDIVLHAAGKAHAIPHTKEEEQAFFDINFQGTINLCKRLEIAGLPQNFIFISTVAVYGCEKGVNITEDHPLYGTSPYALSKIMAEQYLQEWSKKNKVILSILRPSLIAGKNAPGNLGAMVKGIKTGKYLSIAGGKARKSVIMVEDIATLIPKLLDKGGIYNICDDSHPSFRELERLIASQLNKKFPLSIPFGIAKSLALVGDCIGSKSPINSLKLQKITQSLTFCNEKAKKKLGWQPLNVLDNYKIK